MADDHVGLELVVANHPVVVRDNNNFVAVDADDTLTEFRTGENGGYSGGGNSSQRTSRNQLCIGPRKSTKRNAYLPKDGVTLMRYIIHYQLHPYVNGNEIWKAMEDFEVLKNRTWNSMRSHFLKTLLQDPAKYGASEWDIRQLRKTRKEIESGKCHHPPHEVLDKMRK